MGYSCDITKRFNVTFTKNHSTFKAGDVADMTFPIAEKLVKKGVATASQELYEYGKSIGVKFKKKDVDK